MNVHKPTIRTIQTAKNLAGSVLEKARSEKIDGRIGFKAISSGITTAAKKASRTNGFRATAQSQDSMT